MKRIIMSFFLLVLISFFSGCGHNSQYIQEPRLIRHSYVTNYKIGEVKTAYIGQSIVKVKDYYASKGYEKTTLEPTEDFTLTAIAPSITHSDYKLNISGLKSKQYEVYHKTKSGSIVYDLIYFRDSNGNMTYGVLIDDAGNIKKNALQYTGIIVTPRGFTLQPSNVKFNKAIIKYDDFLCDANINYSGNTCGDLNHELVYSGINNVSMNIMYREYTISDYAKPSFYQNLTFEPNAKHVRFKDYVIDILEATNDKVVYRILSDGLKQTEFKNGENQDFERIKSSRK
jgi:hypothetical protein